jgi:phosphoribosylformylglycinamidine synthase
LGIEDGYPEAPNVPGERALCGALAEAAKRKVISSAHDCSDGGLAVALAEIAIIGGLSIDAGIGCSGVRKDAALFGEVPGRVVVGSKSAPELENIFTGRGLKVEKLGSCRPGSDLRLRLGEETLDWRVSELAESYRSSIHRIMCS